MCIQARKYIYRAQNDSKFWNGTQNGNTILSPIK